jgi:hypothetical protein
VRDGCIGEYIPKHIPVSILLYLSRVRLLQTKRHTLDIHYSLLIYRSRSWANMGYSPWRDSTFPCIRLITQQIHRIDDLSPSYLARVSFDPQLFVSTLFVLILTYPFSPI